MVDAIERILPGTATWYDHPLWRLAKPSPVSVLELGELLRRLPTAVREGWVAHRTVPGQLFWREQAMSLPDKAGKLLLGNGLDQAAGALGLLHDALLRQDEEDYLRGWTVWALVGERVHSHPVCGVLYPNFFGALARILRSVAFASTPVQDALDAILKGAEQETLDTTRQSYDDAGMRRLRKALASKAIAPIALFDLVLLEELTLAPAATAIIRVARKEAL